QGRRGPRVLQPYYDIAKLFGKEALAPFGVSWVFLAAPVVAMTSADRGCRRAAVQLRWADHGVGGADAGHRVRHAAGDPVAGSDPALCGAVGGDLCARRGGGLRPGRARALRAGDVLGAAQGGGGPAGHAAAAAPDQPGDRGQSLSWGGQHGLARGGGRRLRILRQRPVQLGSPVLPAAALAVAVAVAVAIILVSCVLMIVRRDVASQAIGFFALENGVSLASMVVAAGLPLLLEVAFLFDLLVAVVVFAVLIRVHHEQPESLSTATLTELRG
ncbi:MAG: NADH-quinone oxidoreductase subunit H, partial [Pseudonocardiales bacterium]|nr:NADH-quinone oxidoreductase subunit H [Pseudonocardiales bacterium]